jgi:hypothetical protein
MRHRQRQVARLAALSQLNLGHHQEMMTRLVLLLLQSLTCEVDSLTLSRSVTTELEEVGNV